MGKQKKNSAQLVPIPPEFQSKASGNKPGDTKSQPRSVEGKFMSKELLDKKKAQNKSGRKKGQKDTTAIMREMAEEAFLNRTEQAINKLFNAQLSKALGCSFLMRVDKDDKGKDMRPAVVEDLDEIKDFLAGNMTMEEQDRYYYITTKEPDNRAIDSLLDRLFGKAPQKIIHGNDNKAPVIMDARQAMIIAQIYAHANVPINPGSAPSNNGAKPTGNGGSGNSTS